MVSIGVVVEGGLEVCAGVEVSDEFEVAGWLVWAGLEVWAGLRLAKASQHIRNRPIFRRRHPDRSAPVLAPPIVSSKLQFPLSISRGLDEIRQQTVGWNREMPAPAWRQVIKKNVRTSS